MTQLTLPGLARKRRDLRAEAAIPCATGPRTATHLTGDRDREPSFEDLLAGNDREPSHADLTTADNEAAEQPRPKAYPGVAIDTMAWLRDQDVDDQLATVAAKAAEWLRAQEAADKQLPTPAPAAVVDGPPAPTATEETPAADHDEHAFDVDHLVPVDLCTVDLAQLDTETDSSVAETDVDETLTVPAGNPRLLFDALDALDRLPALYAVDAESAEMAASTAAIQTYLALRPDLLRTSSVVMGLAPLVALLKLVDAEQDVQDVTGIPADGAL